MPRSPHHSSCNFFLWEYLKTKVFQNQSSINVETQKKHIHQKINDILEEMLRNLVGNFDIRQCVQHNRSHQAILIFFFNETSFSYNSISILVLKGQFYHSFEIIRFDWTILYYISKL